MAGTSRLTPAQRALWAAVQAGDVLKVHRTLDGAKEHRLHPLDGAPARPVAALDVAALVNAGLIRSNMKFPAATYVVVAAGPGDYSHRF